MLARYRHEAYPFLSFPFSNRASSFPAHGLTMIFVVRLAPGTSRFTQPVQTHSDETVISGGD
jgi:hypothetical protein